MTTHHVGPNGPFRTIAEAVQQAQEGDVVEVQAGNYVDDFVQIYVGLTLCAVEGRAMMTCTRQPPNGKAMITTSGNVTIEGFEISGVTVKDQNGAAVRYEGAGTLTLDQVFFHHNENGVMGGQGDHVVIRNSEFAHNGSGSGQTHNIYIGDVSSLTVDNCYFHDANVGHNIKSRAASTTITNTRVFDLQAGTSYSIDAPNGGDLVIEDCVVQQGPNTQNPAVVAYGEEGVSHPGTNVRIARNVFVNDAQRGNEYLMMNRSGRTITIEDNTVYGLGPDRLGDNVSERNTTFTDTRPELDESPMDFDDALLPPIVIEPTPPDPIEPPDVIELPPPDPIEPPTEQPPPDKPGHGHTPTHDPSDPGQAHVKGGGDEHGKSDQPHGKGGGGGSQ